MLEGTGPRLFALPPGADFPAALAEGLIARAAGRPPEALAQVELYLNSARMLRRVQEELSRAGARLLPRLRLVTDPAEPPGSALPPPVPALRRRLELAQLVARLLDLAPDLAPRAAVFDLADSLAQLIDEMQGEGVGPGALRRLDVSEHSRHWERSLRFLTIAAEAFGPGTPPDAEGRRRAVIAALATRWQADPPAHPVIVAGSTGSRGTTAMLMQAVAGLPQGALVLPGFDADLPAAVWATLGDAETGEDHPQYRYRRLFDALGLGPTAPRPWLDRPAPAPARNRLISLALRPAPVTDQWLTDGPALGDLGPATAALTLIEAPTPRAEAGAIALCLREALEAGCRAALVTPDRELARRVTAALDRWGLRPDDSAGRPLGQSAPGRLLRHCAALPGRRLTAETLLTLLKHPLAATGADRGPHLRLTRELELDLRRHGPVFPDGPALLAWAARGDDRGDWAAWLAALLDGAEDGAERPLAGHVARLRRLAEGLAAGPGTADPGALWAEAAGESARAAMDELAAEAEAGGRLGPGEFAALLSAHLDRFMVRETVESDPRLAILGPREARELGAGRVVLAGLNDGSWPGLPAPDPWLNRQMRLQAGLLLPERQIGLSAHDFQIAAGAPEVILSRALRDAEAETVPSRWLNRLTNLLGGLKAQGGEAALAAMRARGAHWVALARALEAPQAPVPAAPRPAPRPPVEARPKELPVTGIRTLIRDPYAIYARHILRLRPLDPLRPEPDARERGSVLHAILERFVAEARGLPRAEARARLLSIAAEVLEAETPWPAARRLWHARLARVADWFLATEAARGGVPVLTERAGAIALDGLDFTLTARPDRIDRLEDGRLHILDYKTGTPPTEAQQRVFDKQLLLEAAMAERGAFPTLGPAPVARITYVGLGTSPKQVTTPITPEITTAVWDELHRLIAAYRRRATGYAARRALFESRIEGDYDHLARWGEWDMTSPARPVDVG